MADESPIVEEAKAVANTPTLAELEAQVNKRKQIEGRIRVAAAQKEIQAVCAKYGIQIGAVPAFTQDGRVSAEIAFTLGKPATNGNGDAHEG